MKMQFFLSIFKHFSLQRRPSHLSKARQAISMILHRRHCPLALLSVSVSANTVERAPRAHAETLVLATTVSTVIPVGEGPTLLLSSLAPGSELRSHYCERVRTSHSRLCESLRQAHSLAIRKHLCLPPRHHSLSCSQILEPVSSGKQVAGLGRLDSQGKPHKLCGSHNTNFFIPRPRGCIIKGGLGSVEGLSPGFYSLWLCSCCVPM